MLTDTLPRVPLGIFPTPIEELVRLSRFLSGPRLYVKRDDQTGLATGGNKTRKLEFSVAEALRQGADTLITLGGVQSNHCRQTAAAAARYGLRCILVLRGNPPPVWNGNLLLNRILGAEVRFSGTRTREEVANEVVEEERTAGRKPFFIPLGASDGVGSVGYVAAMEELASQLKASGLEFDRIVFASSSFGTQAGMCVGAKALNLPVSICPVSIDSTREELQNGVAEVAGAVVQRLGLNLTFTPEEIFCWDDYLGEGYAVMGPPEKEAIDLCGRYEGLLLDPVYTGRAMAGLIDLIRKGTFRKDETILFWHTGGTPALYAYAEHWNRPNRAG
ncbi:MAG TPA: D-cysteine desulfhydrase family protein [Spirochaetales bacterium]|nr:D-cysteine desulfhydrase family protein [Spirochaetales bacterium]